MPKIDDHPVRVARIYAGLSQEKLAAVVGINRATLSALEEARIANPKAETLDALTAALALPDGELERRLASWRTSWRERGPVLTPVAKILLQQPPTVIARFPSFVDWRKRIAPTATAFASMLGLSRGTLTEYERGIRTRGMPEALSNALMHVLKINGEYLRMLQLLPPSDEQED